MAEQTIQLDMTKAALVSAYSPDQTGKAVAGNSVTVDRQSFLFMGFEALSSALNHKKLISINSVGVRPWSEVVEFSVEAGDGSFNENTLTWNTKPDTTGASVLFRRLYPFSYMTRYAYDRHTVEEYAKQAKDFLKNNCLVISGTRSSGDEITLYGGPSYDSTGTPYITIKYDDAIDVTSQIRALNNISGYIDKTKQQEFQIGITGAGDAYCVADFTIASATLYWKEHDAGSYNSIAASSPYTSITVPANTFPANATIDWYLSGTDNEGTTSQTSVYQINTIDAEAVATTISPMNTVEDGGSPITFRWSLSNNYGNEPSLIKLFWKKPSDVSWTELLSSSVPVTSYTAAADTFPPGEIQWLVYAYNLDNVKGPESEGAFICVAAPLTPSGINSDGVPYATITWQSDGQQAYRITVDDIDYGVRFGAEKSFQVDEPLSDGEYTVSIITQGAYGLWSNPGTAIITIENTAGGAITLSGTAGADAILSWDAASGDFYIFRDGVKIGHTDRSSFTDALAIGTHNYYVVNRLPDGNYSRSNSIALTMQTDAVLISEFPPQQWLDINLSENSMRQQAFSYQKTMTTRHIYGAAYPVLENSSFEDMSGTYDTAFSDPEKARQFEELKGKAVCIKGQGSDVFVGAMGTLQKVVNEFYTAFTFSLIRIHWEDFVDDALG